MAARNIFHKMWSGALNLLELMAVPKIKILRFNDANSDFQQKERNKCATEEDSEFRHETSHASPLGLNVWSHNTSALVGCQNKATGDIILHCCCILLRDNRNAVRR